jgi:hypothetical protein
MIEPPQSSRSIDDQLGLPGLFERWEGPAVFFDSLIFCAAFLVVGHGDISSRRPPRSPSGASVSVSVLSSGTGLAARAPE